MQKSNFLETEQTLSTHIKFGMNPTHSFREENCSNLDISDLVFDPLSSLKVKGHEPKWKSISDFYQELDSHLEPFTCLKPSKYEPIEAKDFLRQIFCPLR